MRVWLSVLALLLVVGCSSKKQTKVGASELPRKQGSGEAGERDTLVASTDTMAIAELEPAARFGPVYFAYDDYNLDEAARDELARAAAYLSKHPTTTIVLEGHTDDRGTPEYNLALGNQRAQTCQRFLGRLGIEEARMRVVSYGEERPAVEGEGEAAWGKNRRVEIVVQSR
jgi:peptidoglycan-associated lipoprotein